MSALRQGKFIEYGNLNLGECPICGTGKRRGKSAKCASPNDGELVICKRSNPTDTIDGYVYRGLANDLGWSMWGRDNRQKMTDEDRREWARNKEAKEREYENERKKSLLARKTAQQRDSDYELKYQSNSLSDAHRAEFERRGLSSADIERITPYTKYGNLYLPIRDLMGLRVGAQFKTPDKEYKWDLKGENRTKKHDELPLSFWGNRDNPERILFLEGTGFKPYIASLRHPNDLVIGAAGGQFGTSTKQIDEVLGIYPEADLVLYPDGGAVLNPTIKGQYERLLEMVGDRDLNIAWWGQWNKSDGDIDEIPIDTDIEYIDIDRYQQYATNGVLYKNCTKLAKVNFGKTIDLNEKYLGKLPLPNPGTFTYISSGVGTGKTQQLPSLIEAWEKIHPDGKVMSLGYRNALLDQQNKRLQFDSYRTGYGFEDAAIATSKRLAILVDSVLRLNLADIPAGTLLILDEIEAILKHCAIGGTFGSRAAQIQAHVINIIERVLMSGGAVVALEDSITDITVKGLADLTGNRYGSDLIVNRYSRFRWAIDIGWKNPHEFTRLLIARLMAGERIVLSVTSQKYGESIHKIIAQRFPELADKIRRIDSKTISQHRDLMADPLTFLREHPTNLLILSPSVESGFSIDDGGIDPLFDRVMLYAVNLDPRSQLQMLARYRSDCPRDIYVSKRGSEAGGDDSREYKKLFNKYQNIANSTALEQGYGRIKNNPVGEIWNRLECEFKARDAVSSAHLFEFLRHELIEDGHQVNVADWQHIADDYCREHDINIPGDVAADLDAARTEIDDEEARLLFEADGSKMSAMTAQMITRSTNTSYETKIVARKALLNHRLPGEDLSYDFLRNCVVEDRGKYLHQLELGYLIDKLDLAKALDREAFSKQIERPHIIYSQTPKNSQRVRLLHPIAAAIIDLASGREFMASDEIVLRIARYMRSNSYQFWMLFGLQSGEQSIDSKGRSRNTDIMLAGKLLRKLGWQSQRVRQLGTGKDRLSVFAVTNYDCEHRHLVERALNRRYAQTIASAAGIEIAKHATFISNIPIIKVACLDDSQSLESNLPADSSDSILQEIAEALTIALVHREFLQDIVAIYPIEQVRNAANLLPKEQRLRLPI
jgi:hypothetical protein